MKFSCYHFGSQKMKKELCHVVFSLRHFLGNLGLILDILLHALRKSTYSHGALQGGSWYYFDGH